MAARARVTKGARAELGRVLAYLDLRTRTHGDKMRRLEEAARDHPDVREELLSLSRQQGALAAACETLVASLRAGEHRSGAACAPGGEE